MVLYLWNSRRKVFAVILILTGILNVCRSQIKPAATTSVAGKTGTVTAYNPTYPSNAPINYIRTWEPQQPYTADINVSLSTRLPEEVNHATQYFDGLGRPVETVNWQASPGKKDIVASKLYDEFGREQYQYLPYTSAANDGLLKISPFTDQSTFYSTAYPSEQPAFTGEQFYYSHTQFEASPINRPVKTFAPGNSWAGSEGGSAEKGVSTQYLLNNANDHVRIWTITFDAIADNANIPASTAEYAAGTSGQLFKTVSTDEHGNAVVEYRDNQGHVILKKVQAGTITSDYSGYTGFLCTYYIYDELGQLRFVIPPKAVASMASGSNWVLSQTTVNELCFRYEFDLKQRMIAKKVPGAAWVYMVYDGRDRLVFSQDGNLRQKSPTAQWMYTLYDDANRQVQTGIMSYGGTWASLINSTNAASNTVAPIAGSGTYVNTFPADMIVSSRDFNAGDYNATSSITLQNGFTSEDNANFVAQIVTGAASTFSASSYVNMSPFPATGYTLYPLTYTYYDSYSFGTTKSYNTSNNSQLSDGGGNVLATLVALPAAASTQTKSMITGTRVRVLEDPSDLTNGAWMEMVTYYDDLARQIQVQSDNYKGGQDVMTTCYNFIGKSVANFLVHNNPAAGKSGANAISIKTGMLYDHQSRLTKVTKQVTYQGTSYTRTIAQNTYDALGQLKNKKTGQKSATDPTTMEDDNYSYNIRGWLKGVNWYGGTAYASQVNNSSAVNKWFAFDLSYDWGMTGGSLQYNGNITGMRWESGGDNKERAYGYAYDQANRLLRGEFTQNNSSWGTDALLNFDTKIGDGINTASAYDENGNIKQLQQWGLAGTSKQQIDNLAYSYAAGGVSNKLLAVTDSGQQPTVNIGDFNDKNTGSDDYGYDINGNLITDKNKRMNGVTGIDQTNTGTGAIIYNHLNLPYQITVKNDDGTLKGTITYIYDATGNKLEKRTSEAASSYNNNALKQTQTSYMSGFVYEDNKLQFLQQEEGRVRFVQTNINNQLSTSFVYDYFLKDHLGNIRMILTDEQKTDAYPAATMEASNTATENAFYNNVDATRSTLPAGYPTDTYTNPNGYVSKVVAAAGQVKIGPSIVLKVMAGDNFNVRVSSWYKTSGTAPGTPVSPLADLVTALSNGVPAISGGKVLSGQLTGTILNPSVSSFLNNRDAGTITSRPKAYLNWVLFDERFNYVASSSGFEQVPDESYYNNTTSTPRNYPHTKTNLPINNNGYLYVYVSNETQNINVYFDNLQVTHVRGPLLEETHYYPFGLTMSGISSKAAGLLTNKRKFNAGSELQNEEFSDGSGLDLYATNFRSLDPQLGRWWQIDPRPDYAQSLYSAMNNNPIRYNDPFGDTVLIQANKNTTLMYNNGALYNKNGSDYKGKVKGFLKQTFNALNAGVAGSKEAKSMIGQLESSKNNFTIVKGTGENKFDVNPAQRTAGYANQLKTDPGLAPSLAATPASAMNGGAGGTITWDPSGANVWVTGGGQDNNPTTNLMHELFHGEDANNGLLDSRLEDGLKRDEWQATYRENIVRQQIGAPTRAYYRSQDNGGVISPLAPSVIDASNNPIMPSWVPAGWQ